MPSLSKSPYNKSSNTLTEKDMKKRKLQKALYKKEINKLRLLKKKINKMNDNSDDERLDFSFKEKRSRSKKNKLYYLPSIVVSDQDLNDVLSDKFTFNEKADNNLFVIIRNPWEFLVSYFFSKVWTAEQQSFKSWCYDMIDLCAENDEYSSEIEKFLRFGQKKNLDYRFGDEWAASVEVVQYENLKEDLSNLCRENKIKCPKISLERTYYKHYSYYYDNQLKSAVEKLFHDDISLFGWVYEEKKICQDKKFLYLTQSEKEIPREYISLNSETSDLLCLTWKTPEDNTIFCPNSTWTEGRNKLVDHVRSLDQTYLYYIFMDDDAVLEEGSYEEFERLLLKYMPVIGSPRHYKHNVNCEILEQEAHTIYSYDAIFNAFHQDVFFDDTIFPYVECFDHESWWYSQLVVIHYGHQFYRDYTLQFNWCYVQNNLHRPYPRGHDFRKIESVLKEKYLQPDCEVYSHPKESTYQPVKDPSPPLKSYRISTERKKEVFRNYQKKCVIITTINPPTYAIKRLLLYPHDLIIVGDKKTPGDEYLELQKDHQNLIYLSPDVQTKQFPEFSPKVRWNHYCRKNLGYLYAIKNGYEVIAEIDDDTIPYGRWLNLYQLHKAQIKENLHQIIAPKFPNICKLYTDSNIWPRGYPISKVKSHEEIEISQDKVDLSNIYAIQGLVDLDSDVDAICRLVNADYRDDFKFDETNKIYCLPKGVICSGNTQNCIWLNPKVYYYMYLPSTTNFRFCDILRSYIALFGIWSLQGVLAYTGATTFQIRNEHNLMTDFEDEVPMYLQTETVVKCLEEMEWTAQPEVDLLNVYKLLLSHQVVKENEILLVEAWIQHVKANFD